LCGIRELEPEKEEHPTIPDTPSAPTPNATDYGLHAAVFTRDLGLAHEAVHRLEAGAVMVNDSTDYRIDAMPFGGVKLSARVPTPRRLRRQQTSRDGRETRRKCQGLRVPDGLCRAAPDQL